VTALPASSPQPLPSVGTRVRGYAVSNVAASDAVEARAADGRDVILAFGDGVALSREADAIRAVAKKLILPEVVAIEHDDQWGSFLVLRDRRQFTEPPTMHPVRVHSTLRALLNVARALETAGFSWSPNAEDLEIEGEGLTVRRLRGAIRLKKGERLDARTIVERVGTALVERNITIPFELLRAILPRRAENERTIDAVETDINRAAQELSAEEEDPTLAAITDVGLMREQNEDAVQLRQIGDVALAVVCDGVSASRDAHIAAEIASRTAVRHLRDHAAESPIETMDEAIRAAHAAICDAHVRRGNEPLGTTAVAVRVRGARVTVGWVGDSRAYFIAENEAVLLTHDHSWLNEALAAGTSAEEAVRSPFAHALTRCLGPLEGGDAWHAEPEVIDLEVTTTGYVVLCTDGLWNYVPSADEIAELVRPAFGSASTMARNLTAYALACGGQDNVTVAVVRVPGPV
jgi:PPM family protein phosphatase